MLNTLTNKGESIMTINNMTLIYRGYDIVTNENKQNYLVWLEDKYLGSFSLVQEAEDFINKDKAIYNSNNDNYERLAEIHNVDVAIVKQIKERA
tara:strand:+ start:6 stop:287 length:282 start_codon:yes stop_codon:yes gene_type:complete